MTTHFSTISLADCLNNLKPSITEGVAVTVDNVCLVHTTNGNEHVIAQITGYDAEPCTIIVQRNTHGFAISQLGKIMPEYVTKEQKEQAAVFYIDPEGSWRAEHRKVVASQRIAGSNTLYQLEIRPTEE